MKPIEQPKIWYMRDIYAQYAQQLLDAHPEWWGKYEKSIKMRNCFIYAKSENGKVEEKMSWYKWKNAIECYFFKAKDAIIQGEVLRLGAGVGKIRAIRVQRDFSTPSVNWSATFQQNEFDESGHLKKIYFADDDWCRIEWCKFKMLANETSYRFTPAGKNVATKKGFKTEFSQALKKDPLLKYKYKFFPLAKAPQHDISDM